MYFRHRLAFGAAFSIRPTRIVEIAMWHVAVLVAGFVATAGTAMTDVALVRAMAERMLSVD